MRTLHIQNKTGDTVYSLETQVDKAKDAFVEAMLNGNMAYEVKESGNEQIFDFNPDAEKIVVIARQAGG